MKPSLRIFETKCHAVSQGYVVPHIFAGLFVCCYALRHSVSDDIISTLKFEVFPFRNMEYLPIYSEPLSVKNYGVLFFIYVLISCVILRELFNHPEA